MKKLLVVFCITVLVFGVMETANAWTQFNDGGIYNINHVINDDVWVDYNMPGAQTTVNFQPGGKVPYGYQLQGYEDSNINIVGGSTSYFHIYDRTQCFISSGDMDGVFANDNTQVSISGGDMGRIDGYGNSQVSISGGHMYRMFTGNDSQLTISGGDIKYFKSYDNSQVSMFGGSITGDMNLSSNSILTLYGSDFAVDGASIGYGELTSILGIRPSEEPNRILTGILASGEAFNGDFKIGNSAKIVLAPAIVPIPSAIMLFGSGLFGLFGIRRKFKKV